MLFEDMLAALEQILANAGNNQLTVLEKNILAAAWEQESYAKVAERLYLTEGHVKDVAAELWQQLSHVLQVKVSKKTFRGVTEPSDFWATWQTDNLPASTVTSGQNMSASHTTDWADAPAGQPFWGRQAELETLQAWIVGDRCRLVALQGMGGIGKTALAALSGQQLQRDFEYVIWRSLLNAPPLTETLMALLAFFSDSTPASQSVSLDEMILSLLEHLRQHRCWIILDNVETVLSGDSELAYRPGYEDYDQLFQRVGTAAHQSCLLLTSREKLPVIARLSGPHKPVRAFEMSGLRPSAAKQLVQAFGEFVGHEADWLRLVEQYQGNPLALELAAQHIEDVFFGDIAAFLATGKAVFADIQNLLQWHCDRLSESEHQVLRWLAINREATSLETLRQDILPVPEQERLPITLQSLNQHLPLVKAQRHFALQPVILEYVTEQWVQQACTAVITGNLAVLDSHALLKTTSPDYIQEAQRRLIVQAVGDRLLTHLGTLNAVTQQCQTLFDSLRRDLSHDGYAAGNLLNLQCQLQPVVGPSDCSQLTIRHGALRGQALSQVDFSDCDFDHTVFTQAFSDTTAVAFSPDGSLLATGHSNQEIHLFRVSDGQLLRVLTEPNLDLWCWHLQFWDEGQSLISTGMGGAIRIWNLQTGHCEFRLKDDFLGSCMAITGPQSHQLISGHDDRYIRIWDMTTHTCVTRIEREEGWTWSLALSPNGEYLACGGQGSVQLWHLATQQCVQEFVGHTGNVRQVAFVNAEILVSGSLDGTVRFWRIDNGDCVNTLGSYPDQAYAIAVDRPGARLFIGNAGAIECWHLSTLSRLWKLQTTAPKFECLSLSPTGQYLVSGHIQQTTKLWDLEQQRCLRTWQGHLPMTLGVAFDESGRYLITGHNTTVRCWSVETGDCLQTFYGHQDTVWRVAWHPNGEQIISCSNDGTLRFWQYATGRCRQVLSSALSDGFWNLAVNGQSWQLAVSDHSGHLFLVDLTRNDRLDCFIDGPDWILSLAFSPDGKLLATGTEPGIIKIWDVASRKCLHTFTIHQPVLYVAFSSDGQTLAATVGHQVQLWQVATGAPHSVISLSDDRAHSLAFTPDGQRLLVGTFGRALGCWQGDPWRCQWQIKRATAGVGFIAIAPDGQMFGTNTSLPQIDLQAVATGATVQRLNIPGPYEGTRFTRATGITLAQATALKLLGAIE